MLKAKVYSIQSYILYWTLMLICLGGSLSLLSAIYMTNHETEEVFDAGLIQAASLIDTLLPHEEDDLQEVLGGWQREQASEHAGDLTQYLGQNLDHEEQESVEYFTDGLAVIIQDKNGQVLFNSIPGNLPEAIPVSGFSELELGEDEWRVFSIYDSQRELWISSAQNMPLRSYLGLEISLSFIPALAIAALLLCLGIYLVVRKGMEPLVNLGHELSERDPNNLTALTKPDLAEELNAPIDALNSMFAKVEDMLERERRFTDDAAHELRTPLAALRMFINTDNSNETQLNEGVVRMERLINQLLELARLNPQNAEGMQTEAVALPAVAGDVIAELYPQVLNRNMDVELQHTASDVELSIQGQPVLLGILLRNLIENAIRYSNEGDKIQIELLTFGDQVQVRVIDHGPGLSDEQKAQVFERFYRAGNKHLPGAGLGMTIVKTIVELHQGNYELCDTPEGGLTVQITLPV
ncbi:ATP-binding protein [Aliamphritea ceti]|uniref:ATP-binding protein n=1 Tax=Aliamphritea ceti TaxID=1524258 RepID=UPI0021C330FC|nr:ATP-binding protein [Aliamphritea ceti]